MKPKGYYTSDCFIGFFGNERMKFASESEYDEMIESLNHIDLSDEDNFTDSERDIREFEEM
jgi:hypothetical protein